MNPFKASASAVVSISLLLGATPLYARDLIRSVETGKGIFKECWTLPGTQQGRCVNDVNKQWQREKKLFLDERDAKVKRWRLDHAYLGVSTEYREAYNAFSRQIQLEWREFTAKQNAERKEFFEMMEAHAGNAGASSSSSRSSQGQSVDLSAEEDARVKCARIKDDRAQRICVRQHLRINANATVRGGASWRTRGQ